MESQLRMLLIAIICVSINRVTAKPDGTPTNDDTCLNMTPNHGVDAQKGDFPYILSLDSEKVSPGGTVNLKIFHDTKKFKGFMVQARKSDFEKETQPMGTFSVGTDVQTMKCFGVDDSSVTHVNNADKSEVTITWTAPQKPGQYVIVATVAENGGTFWTRNPTGVINVA